jgi:hypothetical protein
MFSEKPQTKRRRGRQPGFSPKTKRILMENEEYKPAARQPKPTNGPGFALIRLHARSGVTEPAIVSVGVNGKPYNMQRNKDIPVPWSVVHALENAKLKDYAEEGDEQTRRRVFIGWKHRYPFDVIRKLDQAKYDALRSIALERDIVPEDLQQLGM